MKFQFLNGSEKIHLPEIEDLVLVIVDQSELKTLVCSGSEDSNWSKEIKNQVSKFKIVPKLIKAIAKKNCETNCEQIKDILGVSPQIRILKPAETAEVFVYANGKIQLRTFTRMKSSVATSGRCRVLIVDDSATVRKILRNIMTQNPNFEVVGEVEDPLQVEKQVKQLNPDVMTLDINMPGMNGVEVLRHMRTRQPIPAVLVSSLLPEESHHVLDALELGAVDYIHKPSLENLKEFGQELCEKLLVASRQRNRSSSTPTRARSGRANVLQGDHVDINKIIAIGASTGGTEAIRAILEVLPKNIPPIVIVQHIPPYFSKAFADRLNEVCQFEVREARDGDALKSGLALIAPGGFQMRLKKGAGHTYQVEVAPGELVSGHKPSVDELFNSISDLKLKNILGVILTGMGGDGAKGLLKIRELGNFTIGQDEESSIVYGMPKVAMKLGAVTEQVALDQIAAKILNKVNSTFAAKGA